MEQKIQVITRHILIYIVFCLIYCYLPTQALPPTCFNVRKFTSLSSSSENVLKLEIQIIHKDAIETLTHCFDKARDWQQCNSTRRNKLSIELARTNLMFTLSGIKSQYYPLPLANIHNLVLRSIVPFFLILMRCDSEKISSYAVWRLNLSV